jgi:hypothetical protein
MDGRGEDGGGRLRSREAVLHRAAAEKKTKTFCEYDYRLAPRRSSGRGELYCDGCCCGTGGCDGGDDVFLLILLLLLPLPMPPFFAKPMLRDLSVLL